MPQVLTSRAIIGAFYHRLEQDLGGSYLPMVGMRMSSDQESETYQWLGQTPAMREWIGGRVAKGLGDFEYTIRNKKFEATLEIPVDWMERDKTEQIQVRINEMASRANSHWAKLVSDLIIAGESTTCYDGQYFFDTDHLEHDSGTQDNDLSYAAATGTTPTLDEMKSAILQSVRAIVGFKDDNGEPMNENAREFLVMVPLTYMEQAASAIGAQVIGNTTNTLITLGQLGGFGFKLAVNPRLSWTTKFATFRVDGDTKPFILQEESPLKVSALAEGSEVEFTRDVHQYGIKTKRNVGYGMWQQACLTTFT
jgi:phage major head subunit gpT-like protein